MCVSIIKRSMKADEIKHNDGQLAGRLAGWLAGQLAGPHSDAGIGITWRGSDQQASCNDSLIAAEVMIQR
jgi:hypothetical protein